jgi:hypothetical protein
MLKKIILEHFKNVRFGNIDCGRVNIMSKLPNDCIRLFYFQFAGEGEEWFEGDST